MLLKINNIKKGESTMKKKILAFLLAAAMTFSLAACGDGSESSNNESSNNQNSNGENSGADNQEDSGEADDDKKSGEVTKITFWSMAAEDNDPTMAGSRLKKVIDDFNAAHDDIQVELSLGKSYDNIVTAIASSDTPDLFHMWWQYASPLSARGALYDLTDFVNNDADFDKADFLDKAWKLCTVNDRIYSIPFTASTSFAYYNINVLEKAGYKEFPKTVEEMIQCAKDCYDLEETSMGLNPLVPWMDNVMWPAMLEASWEDADGNPVFDTPEMRSAYALQKELIDYQGGYQAIGDWKTDYGSSLDSVTNPILTGQCGFLLLPDSSIASVYAAGVEANCEYGKDWKIASVPGNSMFTAGVYEMNAKTKDADAAWEVLSWVTSKESMAYFAEGNKNAGALMPRISGLDALSSMDSVCDGVKEAAEILKTAELQSFPMSAYVNEYLDAIGNNMAAYMEGTMDLDTAVKNVQDEVDMAAQ